MALAPLVVFDFDKSLLFDHDSDEYIIRRLGPEIDLRALLSQHGKWTLAMSSAIALLWTKGVRKVDLSSAARELKLREASVQSLKWAKAQGCKVIILSDANEFWIKEILIGCGCAELVDEIYSNPFVWNSSEDSPPVVSPFHSLSLTPHNCEFKCPSNLCKGTVLQRLKKEHGNVIYVGDGYNDYCPAAKALSNQDSVFARQNFPLHNALQANIAAIKCTVQVWHTAEGLLSLFQAGLLGSPTN